MFETASFETDILAIAHFHGSISTTQPSLIIELVVILTVYLRTQLICLRQIHACL